MTCKGRGNASPLLACKIVYSCRTGTHYEKGVDPVILAYTRTIILYLVLIGVIRLMGKRQVGQLEASEFVVTMLVADLASIPMQDGSIPLLSGLVPILTVLGLELILSALAMRSQLFRKLLCGKPVILIENGRILQKNLRKTRVTIDELTAHLRQKDVLSPEAVQYAILETDGSLSVFPFPAQMPASAADAGITPSAQHLPITLISDGHLLTDNLLRSGKDIGWVQKQLKNKKTRLEETWLLTVDSADRVVFYRREC